MERLIGCRRLLVIVYGHLSDTMAATPALRSLRAALPRARIEVLALRSARPVLAGCPYVDQVIEWGDFQHKGSSWGRVEKGAVVASLGLRLRRRGYDATLVLHRSNRAMRRLAGTIESPIRAGVSDGSDGYTHFAPAPMRVESSRQENARVLASLGVAEDGGPVELWTSAPEKAGARRMLSGAGRPLVGIHPGADWSCQQWLPERFGEVAATLQRTAGASIVITGSTNEVGLADEIAAELPDAPIRLAGRTSFGELVEIIRGLDLLVCVSSAASAVADAVATPSVVLMGPEDAGHTGMEPNPSRRLIQPGGSRAPGSWCELGRWGVLSGCESPICRGVGGLAELSAGAVAAAALEMLKSPGVGAAAS
ncbi:MAG TPA: glycosyltransferase family 9 protein [Candidatus Binatia bacterium]|nr:glycosyltransferase family 9 protein [Candidatus Binatia bacterium]